MPSAEGDTSLIVAALREAEAKYHDLYDNAPDMFVSVDAASATIQVCNQTFASVLGYSKQELLGLPIVDMYDPQCLATVRGAFEEFRTHGTVRGVELQLRRKEGSTIDVSLNVSAVRDAQDKIIYSRSILRDITERKEAERALRLSEERFALAVLGSHDGIWDWDIRSNASFYSARCQEMLGYAHGELAPTYESWAARLHADDRQRVAAALQLHLTGGVPYDVEFRAQTRGGQWRWFQSRGQAVWDETGQPLRMAGSMTDIHERKQSEFLIHQLNAELEQRVRDRTGQLEATVAELRAALDEVRTLKGLIPICAWCKSIRNDRGFWEQLEAYMVTHTEVQFTHSQCPTCFQKQEDAPEQVDVGGKAAEHQR